MKEWRVYLKDQRGTAFPLIIAVTLTCFLILCGIMESFRPSPIAFGVGKTLQDTVVVVVSDNCANTYHGVRKGYSGGYCTRGYGFEEAVGTGDIYYHLDETLGTRRGGGNRAKHTGGVLECKITRLDVEIRNTPLVPSDPANTQRFEADAMVWLRVPVQPVGKTFLSVKIKFRVQAGYTKVF